MSELKAVDFTRVEHTSLQGVEPEELYTALKRLTVIHAALLTEDPQRCSIGEETIYCVLLCRWVRVLETCQATVTGEDGLWFPMPNGGECDCVLAEIYFRVFRCVQRILTFAYKEDVLLPGTVDVENAVPYPQRLSNQAIVNRLMGVITFVTRKSWPEREETLERVGLPLEYRNNLRRCLRAYGLWNPANIVAKRIESTVNHTDLPSGMVDAYTGWHLVSELDADPLVLKGSEASAEDDVLDEFKNMELSAAVKPAGSSVDLEAICSTSNMDGDSVHLLDRPSVVASHCTSDVFSMCVSVVHMLYTCRSLLCEVPAKLDLGGVDKHRCLSVLGRKGTNRVVMFNLATETLSLDSSQRLTSGRAWSSSNTSGPVGSAAWSELAKVHFLLWMGRYYNLIQQVNNSLACKRAAIGNGALVPGIYTMETVYGNTPLVEPVPSSCMTLVKQLCVLKSKVLVEGKDPNL